jgi:hypothetical protein
MAPYVEVDACNEDGGDGGGNCDGMGECSYVMNDCDVFIELVKTEYFLDSDDYVDLHD